MEQVGCLSSLIALFAVIGSIFTGSYYGASAKAAPQPVSRVSTAIGVPLTKATMYLSPDPVILEDRAGALGEPLTKELAERLLQESVDVLKLRFPRAEVSLEEAGPRSVRQIVIRTEGARTESQLRSLAVSSGEFRLEMVATAADAERLKCDVEKEIERAHDWLNGDGARSVSQYNRLSTEEGGPTEGLRMALVPALDPRDQSSDSEGQPRSLLAVNVEVDPEWRFQRDDMARFFASFDLNGRPAIGFDIAEDRQGAFEAFTGAHIGEQLTVVMDGRVLTSPKLNGPLRSGGIITGGGPGFGQGEVTAMISLLNAPRLPMPLVMTSMERR